MARFVTGNTFSTSDQVTAAKLNNAVNNAAISTDSVDDSTIELNSNALRIKDGGVSTDKLATSSSTTTGVTFAKMQHVAANTVLVRDANSEGDISAKAVADTQILIGDGTGFTAAALSGDATMTNAGVVDISDDVALGGNPTATTQSAGNDSTRIATTAFVTAAVTAATDQRAILKSASGGARSGSTYYFNNMSEVSDPDSIVSFSSGDITFASTGTYLIEMSGNFEDNDTTSDDNYSIQFTSSTSSTTNLLDGDGHTTNNFENGVQKSITQRYIRTVSDVSTDKLAIYASPISFASSTQWNAFDVYVVITKLT